MWAKTYFAWDDSYNPLLVLDRWLHPFCQEFMVKMQGKKVRVRVTERALEELAGRSRPLFVEAQAYFSCVVKKRILFDVRRPRDLIPVYDKLCISFHAVESESCDPWEFAANYPEKRQLTSPAAKKMIPKAIYIDFKHGHWEGDLKL